MKFVIYKNQKKITVENVWLPGEQNIMQIMDSFQEVGLTMHDLQLHEVRITATRGMNFEADDLDNLEIEREIYEGINWRQETVN